MCRNIHLKDSLNQIFVCELFYLKIHFTQRHFSDSFSNSTNLDFFTRKSCEEIINVDVLL